MPFAKTPSFKPGAQVIYTGEQVDKIHDELFNASRTPRSLAYKRGCLDVLNQYLCKCPGNPYPYEAGTPEFDAYLSGRDEGRDIAQAHIFGDLNMAGGAV